MARWMGIQMNLHTLEEVDEYLLDSVIEWFAETYKLDVTMDHVKDLERHLKELGWT